MKNWERDSPNAYARSFFLRSSSSCFFKTHALIVSYDCCITFDVKGSSVSKLLNYYSGLVAVLHSSSIVHANVPALSACLKFLFQFLLKNCWISVPFNLKSCWIIVKNPVCLFVFVRIDAQELMHQVRKCFGIGSSLTIKYQRHLLYFAHNEKVLYDFTVIVLLYLETPKNLWYRRLLFLRQRWANACYWNRKKRNTFGSLLLKKA